MKYPWCSKHNKNNKKFGAYISEEQILKNIADKLGLIKIGEGTWCRHPLAYLVEAADDICYAILDLEDAVELKILDYKEVESLYITCLGDKITEILSNQESEKNAFRVKLFRLRGPVFDFLIKEARNNFHKNYNAIMRGDFQGHLLDKLSNNALSNNIISEAKNIGKEKIYSDPKKIEIELGSYIVFDTLLKAFCDAAINQSCLLNSQEGETNIEWKSKLVLNLLGDHAPHKENAPDKKNWSAYQCLRRTTDFICGMTDNYATYIAKQLSGMGYSGIQRP